MLGLYRASFVWRHAGEICCYCGKGRRACILLPRLFPHKEQKRPKPLREEQKIVSPQGTGKDPLLLGSGKKKPLLLELGDKIQS